MSYQVTYTNGNLLTIVPDTQLVSTYGGLELIGKDAVGFGTMYNNNLVHLAENFADNTPPVNPFIGQVWYDTVSETVSVWNGAEFKPFGIFTSSDSQPTDPQEGNQWFNTSSNVLSIWNGIQWIIIGPPNSISGNEGWVPQTNIANVVYLNLYVNNTLMAIASSVEIDNPGIDGFGNIRPGINFVSNPDPIAGIPATGIYNLTELTIGGGDQIIIIPDGNDNGLFQVNGENVFIASNGNITANLAAYNDLINGNIVGTLYANTLIANNYEGLPVLQIPGTIGEVIFNNGIDILGASDALIVTPSNVIVANSISVNNSILTNSLVVNSNITTNNLTANIVSSNLLFSNTANIGNLNAGLTTLTSLEVSTNETIDGDLLIEGRLTVNGATQLDSASINELVVTEDIEVSGNILVSGNTISNTIYATTYLNLPVATIPGSDGQVLYNHGGGGWLATPDLTIDYTNHIITANSLIVENNTSIDENLTVGGTITLNNNSPSTSYELPPIQGGLGSAILAGIGGTTNWSTANIAQWSNGSFAPTGFQILPNGLILQWGTVSSSLFTTYPYGYINLSPAFPNAIFFVGGTPNNTYLGEPLTHSDELPIMAFNYSSTGPITQILWRMDTNKRLNFGGTVTFQWFAIGY